MTVFVTPSSRIADFGLALLWYSSLLLLFGCSAQKTALPVKVNAKAVAVTQDPELPEQSEPAFATEEDGAEAAQTGEVPSADGVVIRYEVRGTGAPALVFIHGWCCNRTFWEPQFAHFAKSQQVVAIDLAGHGDSGLERKAWTMAAFGADVAAVVKHLKLDKVVLVGHSMGGPVMLEAAPLLRDELVGLVGVDTLTDPDEHYSPAQIQEYAQPFTGDFAQAMRGALRHEHDFFTAQTDPALIDRIEAQMSAAPADVGRGAFIAMFDFANDLGRERMAEVKVPLVCINAAPDPKKVEAGRKYAPQFEVLTLPDSGHFLMMEHPVEFNALLEQILKKMSASGDPVAR